jgi:cellulose synthase/poly-beta-1,6-N-acetylglucosamine synthase-like glycosyltransferase
MPALLLLSFAPLLVFALTAILNALTFPRLRAGVALPAQPPRVSVLLPMRNEAAVIGETVRSLLAQEYPNLEILLLDDSPPMAAPKLPAQRLAATRACAS